MLRRAHEGIFREFRSKHVARYGWEFAGGQILRDRDTINQMRAMARGTGNKSLRHKDSTVNDVLSFGDESPRNDPRYELLCNNRGSWFNPEY